MISLKGYYCANKEMNRQIVKQYPEKNTSKSSSISNQSREILPTYRKAPEFYSSQNINGSSKSSQNSIDDNDSVLSKNRKPGRENISKSVSSLFESASDDDFRNIAVQMDGFKHSLKFSIESMVYGEKLQMNAELLLLSSSNDLWPLSLHHLNKVNRNFNKFADCYEELLATLTLFSGAIGQFEMSVISCENTIISTEDKISCSSGLMNTVITVMELTYQTVYNIASGQQSWRKSQSGLLDRKTIISSIDEVELCCFRLREILLRSTINDERSPKDPELHEVMLLSCSQFSSALTYLAMCCRTASASVDVALKSSSNKNHRSAITNRPEDNLFHLAMKSVSNSSQCMLASVNNYVRDPNPENKFITESFTNSVSTAVKALAAMATSPKFVGFPSALPVNIKMTRNTICGSCMSLVSPTIQLLQTVAAIYSPNNNNNHNNNNNNNTKQTSMTPTNIEQLCQRAITCIAAMRDALLHFQHTLKLYQNY